MSLNENTSKIEQLLAAISALPEAGGGSGGNIDDEYINALIEERLGVIENGTY